MANEFYRPVPSLAEQRARLDRLLPGFATRLPNRNRLTTEGNITPTPLAATYRVRVDYEVGGWPQTRVLSPALVLRPPWARIPHMYGQERLCLFVPRAGEWSRHMLIATTVIPWAAEWLHYYELWHLTGEWLGGGAEPEDNVPVRRPSLPQVTHARR